jgi:hypothetical protein
LSESGFVIWNRIAVERDTGKDPKLTVDRFTDRGFICLRRDGECEPMTGQEMES